MIDVDAAWEDTVLPALSDYTRIPCLSPAFDHDWAERGAITEAAELLGAWVRDQDPALAVEIIRADGSHPAPVDRQRRHGRPRRHLRPHGQAAPARRVAQRARALRAGARGRPPLRPGHGGRRLRDVCRRDGSAGGGRRARPRAHPHRGERGERQPGPDGPSREPRGAHRHPPSRHLPRLGRAQLRPALADDVVARVPRGDRAGGRPHRRRPQRRGGRRRAVVVPDPAPHSLRDRGRGDRPHPPAGIAGGGDPRGAPGKPRGRGGGVPRQRGADRRRPAPAHAGPGRASRGAHLGCRPRGHGRRRAAQARGRRQRAASLDHAQAVAATARRTWTRRRRPTP